MLNVVILAAGKGTRMHSALPKVLHPLAGKPMLAHVIERAKQLNPSKIIVVVGFGGDTVKSVFQHENIVWVEQREQLGTGHAVQQAVPYLDADAKTIVMLGDVPLVDPAVCQSLIEQTTLLGLLTYVKVIPKGYGRIVRNADGEIQGIVEEKDATEAQRGIQEINTGIMVANNQHFVGWLSWLNNDNAQKEYYLTDIVSMAVETANSLGQDGTLATKVIAVQATNESSITGINSKVDLAAMERAYQTELGLKLLQQGVTLLDPQRIDIRGELHVGQDVTIDVGCVFEGSVTIGDHVSIGPYCVIKEASIASGTRVAAFSHIDQGQVGERCVIGPYARIRPGTTLENEVHVGNFVELKNAQVDKGSKINHLSYVGDSTVGKGVNIGAGTITCNYDGVNKFRTIIEDGAFIGSDSQLVAPVTIGKDATIGAGSTITKDAPPDALTISRGKQVTIQGWKRPSKLNK